MKKILLALMMISFLISSEPEKSVGRYDLKVVTYVSPKTGKLYIVETIFDTKTGEVISRTKFFYKNYNKKKKRKRWLKSYF